ncbi:MAG: hypothetical protein DWQ37_14400 [Planctomycetota bacterium]|nr:MAG: hypothetical protein DWQ37_14400 [Planctomycetota bacterium]
MDKFDRERYAAVYRELAEVLARERPADRAENHLSYNLGELAARVFVGSEFLPPDELLEQVAQVLRSGERDQEQAMAKRLSEHARHLDQIQD